MKTQCVVVYFILVRADALLGAPCARFRRRGLPSWAQPPPSGDGLFGALAAFFRPPADFELSPAAAAAVDELCREDGWDVELELGSLPARAAGGTGTLVRSSQASPTVGLAARVRLECDAGVDPPEGALRLVTPSRLLNDTRAFWRVVDDGAGGVPRAVQMKLEAGDGIIASDVTLVPPGPVYLNARVSLDVPLQLCDGKVTVKEDVGGSFVFDARGILAEYKIVGTFEAAPAAPAASAPGVAPA